MSECCKTSVSDKPAAECCAGDNVLIFACSGGSNVGQISNEAAKRLDQEGVGKFFCLAGFGGNVSGIIASSKAADGAIVIDGCDVACARLALEAAEVPISRYVVVTDEGIEKGHHFNFTEQEIAAVCERVRQAPA